MRKDKNIWSVFNEMMENVEYIKKLTHIHIQKKMKMDKIGS